MRVGLVVYGSLSHTSGGFLYDRTLIEHLRTAGETVEVIELPWRSYPRHLLDNVDPAVRSRLAGADVDVLLQDELCHPSLVRPNERLRGAVPLVAVVHHLRTSEPRAPPARWLYRQVERRYLRTVDGVIATSQATQSAVDALAPVEHTTVVPPGTGRFEPDIDQSDIRTRAHDSGPLRVLFVGSLVPRKGVDTLLDGLARLPPGSWRCTVIGDDSIAPRYVASVRRQVERLGIGDWVRFTGPLAAAEVAAELAEGHVLAMPSRYEGFGIAYLEGMGFGLPPVASTAGGASELVSDGEDGWLVRPNDADAIASTLRPVSTDRDRLTRFGLAALERYEAHPSWSETMDEAHRFLRHIANV